MKKIILILIAAAALLISLSNVAWASECEYAEALDINEDEFRNLALLLSGEAGGDSSDGQRAVVEVIANRAMDDGFPDDITAVMSQEGQFCAWKGRKKKAIMQSQIDAIEAVRTGSESVMTDYIETAGYDVDHTEYVYFCTEAAYRKKGHRYMRNIIRIGAHVFGTA